MASGTARAVRIFKTYGHEAIQVMTEDPYRLARDVRGIGFRTADAIAAKLGMEKTAPQRLRAGVSFALQTATDEGHCALPVEAAYPAGGETAGGRGGADPYGNRGGACTKGRSSPTRSATRPASSSRGSSGRAGHRLNG